MSVNTKSGVVLAVGQPQQIASKTGKMFVKRSLYIDCTPHDGITGERSQYENKLLFEFTENKTSLLDNIQVGQVVTVSFDLQGTEYTDQSGQTKYYIHVRPFGVEVRRTMQPQAPQSQYVQKPPQYRQSVQQFPPQVDAGGVQVQNGLPF